MEGNNSKPTAQPDKAKINVDAEKILTVVEDIIDTLTFRRVTLLALLITIGLILFSIFENRQGIIVHFASPVTIDEAVPSSSWVLSDASKLALQHLAKTTSVAFVVVTDVDLKKNRKLVRYYFIDDVDIKLSQASMQALGLPQAVFDYDAKNTAQMVSVLSNEFRCDVFRDTIYYRFAPEISEKIPSICRIAIPPFVGQFVGFLTVGLSRQPTKQELDTIRLEVSRLAVEIYLNDVVKKP